jgi:hypothetical protein
MPTNGVPTLQDLIAKSGVDPSFFGQFGATEFGGQLGLKGEQLSGFKKFANIMKFDPKRIEDLLSSIGEFGEQQTGFIQEQFGAGQKSAQSGYGRGVESLRSGAIGQMAGARQQTGGFAGSGAQQRSMSLLGQAGRRGMGGLQSGLSEQLERLTGARKRGLAGLQEQMESRIGQTQGLLGDYISRLTQLGSQFLSYDPGGGGGDPETDKEDVPQELTTVPTVFSGNMINVNGIMYRWNPDTKQYELAEGDPDTLPKDDTLPGNGNTKDNDYPGFGGGLGDIGF